jgi:hypothetical protein
MKAFCWFVVLLFVTPFFGVWYVLGFATAFAYTVGLAVVCFLLGWVFERMAKADTEAAFKTAIDMHVRRALSNAESVIDARIRREIASVMASKPSKRCRARGRTQLRMTGNEGRSSPRWEID